ncbi:hypothetical protein BGZ94_003845 [Podila epigama]|nr:hypothetical protein BGZ94_003845 [Podila epigama]
MTRAGSPVSHAGDGGASSTTSSSVTPSTPAHLVDDSDDLPPLPIPCDPFDPEPSWDTLSNHMTDVIQHILHSADNNYKPYFQTQATQIVQSVRVMLYASGTVDKDSAPIRMHKELKVYHRQIMAALSKLVLSARMATSLWADEAATAKMKADATDVARAVRSFIQTAQEANIKVHEVDAKLIPNPESPGAGSETESESSRRLSRVLNNTSHRSSAERGERITVHATGSSGVFVHLDYYSRSVFRSLNLLVLHIRKILSEQAADADSSTPAVHLASDSYNSEPNVSANANVNANAAATLTAVLTHAQSSHLVTYCHQTISQLSSLLALVSDFYTVALRDHVTVSDQYFLDVRSTKQVLYNNVAALVMAIQLATDPMAQATVLEMTLAAAATAEKSCQEMVVATRTLASECELVERIARVTQQGNLAQSRFILPQHHPQGQQQQQVETTVHPTQAQGMVTHIPAFYGTLNRQSDIDIYFQHQFCDQEPGQRKGTRNRSNSQVSNFSGSSSISNNSPPTTPGTEYTGGSFTGAYPFPITNGHGSTSSHMSASSTSLAAQPIPPADAAAAAAAAAAAGIYVPHDLLVAGRVIESRGRDVRSEKLRRMLGHEVPPPRIKKNENPWYLGHDYSRSDISFNMEGHVRGGTMQALVERLTLHDSLDSNFVVTFLLTYRSFSTTQEFFTHLFRRFSVPAPVGLDLYEMEEWTTRKLTPIRLRVFKIIKTWLEVHYLEDEEEDRQILPRIREFCEANLSNEVISITAMQLIRLVDKRENSDRSLRKMVLNLSTQAPLPITPRNLKRIRFMDLDPLELARQLTIMEANLYNKIRPIECLGKAWTSTDPVQAAKAVNIKKIIEISNLYANWINELVLSERDIKKRAAILKHLVAVAEKLRQLNNFSTLSTTTAALSLSPIHRLRRTWEIVPAKTTNLLESLQALTSSARNWAEYRAELHSVNPPCVPFIGVYLTDLVMIEDGNPDILRSTNNHINFYKRVSTAEVIREIQQYQSQPYCLTTVPEIQAFIRRGLANSKSVSELYDMSLALEPRIRPVTCLPPLTDPPLFNGGGSSSMMGSSSSVVGSVMGSMSASVSVIGSMSASVSVIGNMSASVSVSGSIGDSIDGSVHGGSLPIEYTDTSSTLSQVA